MDLRAHSNCISKHTAVHIVQRELCTEATQEIRPGEGSRNWQNTREVEARPGQAASWGNVLIVCKAEGGCAGQEQEKGESGGGYKGAS